MAWYEDPVLFAVVIFVVAIMIYLTIWLLRRLT